MENTSKTVTCDVCEYVCSFVGDTVSINTVEIGQ